MELSNLQKQKIAKPLVWMMVLLFHFPLWAREGFYASQSLPSRPQNLTSAQTATVRIGKRSPDGSVTWYCSGAVLSSSGQVLTAFHCLGGLIEKLIGSGDISYEELEKNVFLARTLRRIPSLSMTGNLLVRNDSLGFELPVSKISFLSAGLANHKIFDATESSVYAKELPFSDAKSRVAPEKTTVDAIQSFSSDYTLLKIDSAVKLPCLAVEDSELKGGAEIWSIGYPIVTKRGMNDSDGRAQYITQGKVLLDFSENNWLKAILDIGVIEKINLVELSPSKFLSDMDAMPGMSGGPAINEKGKLVGIISSGYSVAEKYHSGTTELARVSNIMTELKKFLSVEQINEILSCNSSH